MIEDETSHRRERSPGFEENSERLFSLVGWIERFAKPIDPGR
jgi:hypothetical protein